MDIGRTQLVEAHCFAAKLIVQECSNDRKIVAQCRRRESSLSTQEIAELQNQMTDRGRLDSRHRGRNAAESAHIPKKLKNSPSVATPGTSATIAPKKSIGTFVAEHVERYIVPLNPRDEGGREVNLLSNRRRHVSLSHKPGFEAIEISGQSSDAGNLSGRHRAVIQIVHRPSP
jgi:hypothetical protein